jgi:hypothetical protein
MASSSAAAGLLSRQLKQMQNDKSISGISCGLVDSNVFEWEVMLMIDDDTKFYGGDAHTHSLRPRTPHGMRRRLTKSSQEAFSARASTSPSSTHCFRPRCASKRPSSTQTVRPPFSLLFPTPPPLSSSSNHPH